MPQFAQPFAHFFQMRCQGEDEKHFHQLGRLQADRAELQPVAVALDRIGRQRREKQRRDHGGIQRRRGAQQQAVVKPRDDQHAEIAQNHGAGLHQQVPRRAVAVCRGIDKRQARSGREQHGDSQKPVEFLYMLAETQGICRHDFTLYLIIYCKNTNINLEKAFAFWYT